RRAWDLLFHGSSGDATSKRERQADNKFAALAQSAAESGNRAAVHLDQPLHQREADAQSALGAVERAGALHEKIEHFGPQRGGNADARVTHAQHRLVILATHRNGDVSSLRSVLDRVADE